MAPPPLRPDGTVRFWLDYTSMQVPHSVLFRMSSTPETPQAYFTPVANAMADLMRQDDRIFGLRRAFADSNVTIPQAWTTIEGTLSNASSIADDPESVFVSLPFRDVVAGRKGRYDFFLPVNIIPLDSNNRIELGIVSQLDALWDAVGAMTLSTGPGNYLVSIANNPIILNGYFNRAKSGYWQRRQRRFGSAVG